MSLDLEKIFTYHPPTGDQAERYESIRAAGKYMATLVLERCSSNRESTIAIRKIEEAVMWANAAIARNEQ